MAGERIICLRRVEVVEEVGRDTSRTIHNLFADVEDDAVLREPILVGLKGHAGNCFAPAVATNHEHCAGHQHFVGVAVGGAAAQLNETWRTLE